MKVVQPPHLTSLGHFLALSPNHHFFDLPIWLSQDLAADASNQSFALLFELDGSPQVVTAASDLGYWARWQSVSHFTKENLLDALTAVPLRALASCHFLALSPDQEELRVLKVAYPDLAILHQLPDLVSEPPLVYNPYRDAYESLSSQTDLTAYQVNGLDRDYEQELRAFELSRKGEVKQVPLHYRDPKTGQTVKLYVRGWYLFDDKPPLQISWKPSHTRKTSWRSSYVVVDKKSGDFFFSGELYKNRQSPIFLAGLDFAAIQPSSQLRKNWASLTKIIQDQKEAYLALLNEDRDK